jgi:hypothetical protein
MKGRKINVLELVVDGAEPTTLSRFYIVYCVHCDKETLVTPTNAPCFRIIFYIAPACFGVIISPSSGN